MSDPTADVLVAAEETAQSELDRMIDSIQASGGLNVVLWVVSLAAVLAAVGWVMFGGPGAESTTRSDAITKLWPLGAAWFAALAAKSKITGGEKREVVRAHAMLSSQRMTHAAATASRLAAVRPPDPR